MRSMELQNRFFDKRIEVYEIIAKHLSQQHTDSGFSDTRNPDNIDFHNFPIIMSKPFRSSSLDVYVISI